VLVACKYDKQVTRVTGNLLTVFTMLLVTFAFADENKPASASYSSEAIAVVTVSEASIAVCYLLPLSRGSSLRKKIATKPKTIIIALKTKTL
jgi:hypothetical protein